MSITEERQFLFWRRERLAVILGNPTAYKTCSQCRSILSKKMGICPFCAAYRFDEDERTLRVTVAIMRQMPFPSGAGFAPRLPY